MDAKYLVLSGGAKNGVVFVGALNFLEHCLGRPIKQHFKGFAGTSVGAFIALCILCEIPEDDLIPIIKMPLHLLNCAVCSKLSDIFVKFARDETITFSEFDKLIDHKPFIVCAVNLNDLKLKLFSNQTTPHVSVLKAIQASMAMPFVFEPVIIDNQMYVDGGCCLNLPIGVFPSNETLAFWLTSKRDVVSTQSLQQNPTCFVSRVVESFVYAQDTVVEALLVPTSPIIRFQCEISGLGCVLNNSILNVEVMKKNGARTVMEFFSRDKVFRYKWLYLDILCILSVLLFFSLFLQKQVRVRSADFGDFVPQLPSENDNKQQQNTNQHDQSDEIRL